ncbi:MAG TPA: hypothetical protein VFC54_07230 [Pseudolabrys sp.]|nr:hypothetical protein [Pseudolabrys sp.]
MNTILTNVLPISALLISTFALALSIITAWLTLFRRGTIKMTQPTQIFFGYDKPRDGDKSAWPKVFLRTLLFATSKRGRVVENIYVKLTCEDIVQSFNVWVYGERDELVRGSGLFVGETGVEAYHHFLTSRSDSPFHFIQGTYRLDVHAHILGQKNSKLLFSHLLNVTDEEALLIGEQNSGLYFDWDPDENRYAHHLKQVAKSFWENPLPRSP